MWYRCNIFLQLLWLQHGTIVCYGYNIFLLWLLSGWLVSKKNLPYMAEQRVISIIQFPVEVAQMSTFSFYLGREYVTNLALVAFIFTSLSTMPPKGPEKP